MITKVGLREAEKSQGSDPTGIKRYLVGSDTKITDDIDTILDASELGGEAVPIYNGIWSGDTTINLRVDTKRATPYDSEDGIQEGFWWVVDVNYNVPDISDNQSEEDPRDRDWLWSKSSQKEERTILNSFLDTSGYVYPESDPAKMVNLNNSDGVTNTAGEPPENGVTGPISNRIITVSKYIDGFADLGVASWEDLDTFIDSVNDADFDLLGITYPKWTLRMDDIDYEPVSEGGYDVIRVIFRMTADTFKTHLFNFNSAGYNEIKDIDGTSTLVPAYLKGGEEPSQPRLLDATGAAIPEPSTEPYIKEPYIISLGVNPETDWSVLPLPASIP